ncbi:MAG: hypothetical protein WDA65_01085 [Christensenellales bacterium]
MFLSKVYCGSVTGGAGIPLSLLRRENSTNGIITAKVIENTNSTTALSGLHER